MKKNDTPDMNSLIRKRVESPVSLDLKSEMTDSKTKYEKLKQVIITRTQTEIRNQLEIAKALFTIKEEKLYEWDQYKSFSQFLTDYQKGRTQAYRYLSVVQGLQDGRIEEKEIIEYGFKWTERKLKSISEQMQKEEEQNPKTLLSKKKAIPLRFVVYLDEKQEHWLSQNKRVLAQMLRYWFEDDFQFLQTEIQNYKVKKTGGKAFSSLDKESSRLTLPEEK